jgi:hypothetical protein
MARVKIPSSVSPETALRELKAMLSEYKPSETGARGAVIKVLSRLGTSAAALNPTVNAILVNNIKGRVYVWEGTVLGDLYLAAGSRIQPTVGELKDLSRDSASGLYHLKDPGAIYVVASDASGTGAAKATRRLASTVAKRAEARAARKVMDKVPAAPTKPTPKKAAPASKAAAKKATKKVTVKKVTPKRAAPKRAAPKKAAPTRAAAAPAAGGMDINQLMAGLNSFKAAVEAMPDA